MRRDKARERELDEFSANCKEVLDLAHNIMLIDSNGDGEMGTDAGFEI